MELRFILEIIWRRRRIVIPIFVGILFVAVLFAKVLPKSYSSSLKIISEKPFAEDYIVSALNLPTITSPSTLSSSSQQDDGDGMDDVLSLAIAPPVLQSVIDRLQLRDSKGRLMKPHKIIDEPVVSLSMTVTPYFSVENNDGSNILEVKAKAGDRDEAAAMANDFAKEIVNASIQERRDGYAMVRSFLESKIQGVVADYEKLLLEVENYKLSEKTVDLDFETEAMISKMMNLVTQKESLLATLSGYKAKDDIIRKQIQTESPSALSEIAMDNNPHIASLKSDLSEMEVELASLLKQKTEEHPDVKLQKERIRAASDELQRELALLPTTSGDLQEIERAMAATLSDIAELDKQTAELTKEINALPGKASGMAKLTSRLTAIQSLQTTMFVRLYEVNLAESMMVSCLRVLGPAVPADIDDPSSPGLAVCGILGAFLGAFFAIGLALVVEYVDESARHLSDFDTLGIPVLGVIPPAPASACLSDAHPRVVSTLTEPIRMLVGSIIGQRVTPPKVIVVTSNGHCEGKSVTAANLALIFAQRGCSTVLVDASITHPRLHELFHLSNSAGSTEADGIATQTSNPLISFVGSGRTSSMEPATLRTTIQQLSAKNKVVIVDTDPVSVSSQTTILASYSDLTVMVIRNGKTSIDNLKRSISKLKDAGTKELGLLPIGWGQSLVGKALQFISNL